MDRRDEYQLGKLLQKIVKGIYHPFIEWEFHGFGGLKHKFKAPDFIINYRVTHDAWDEGFIGEIDDDIAWMEVQMLPMFEELKSKTRRETAKLNIPEYPQGIYYEAFHAPDNGIKKSKRNTVLYEGSAEIVTVPPQEWLDQMQKYQENMTPQEMLRRQNLLMQMRRSSRSPTKKRLTDLSSLETAMDKKYERPLLNILEKRLQTYHELFYLGFDTFGGFHKTSKSPEFTATYILGGTHTHLHELTDDQVYTLVHKGLKMKFNSFRRVVEKDTRRLKIPEYPFGILYSGFNISRKYSVDEDILWGNIEFVIEKSRKGLIPISTPIDRLQEMERRS